MHLLEARFHPRGRAGAEFVAVARVRCQRATSQVTIEPLALGREGTRLDPEAVLAKVRFLVLTCHPEPYPRLLALRSDYWSFVEIEPQPQEPDR